MRIVLISNYLNHHQIPLCEAFVKIPDVEFIFFATEHVRKERVEMGYQTDFSSLSYFKEAIDEKDKYNAEDICFRSDVVILGSAPIMFVKRRLKAKKLTFNYSERWFKDGFFNHPGDIFRAVKNFVIYSNKNFFQLCASAYTASDSNKVFAFPKRKLKWGYFPQLKIYDTKELLERKEPFSLIWVARLIDLKHPEIAVEVAEKLKQEGFNFQLNIIGGGPLKDKLEKSIKEKDLSKYVRMLGVMSADEVRKYMEKSQIFIFTSDFREGWGAVLNEAMNSACSVVVSNAIGSAHYLITQNENGYIYNNGDTDDLFFAVKKLLTDSKLLNKYAVNAYNTMITIWNAEIAAKRLYKFCCAKLNGKEMPVFENGPISMDYGKIKNGRKFKCKKH